MSTALAYNSTEVNYNNGNGKTDIESEQADQYLEWWLQLWAKRDTAWHLDNVHP